MKRFVSGAALLAAMIAGPVRADGPEYNDTITALRSLLNGTLTERQHCSFTAKFTDGEVMFSAGALTVVPSDIAGNKVVFDCNKSAKCVKRATDAVTEMTFVVNGDPQGAVASISRLIEMCGDTVPIN